MKALVLAESTTAQRELCAGARELADTVLLVVIKEAPQTGVADKAFAVELPEGQPYENAYETLQGVVDGVRPDIMLIEPTPRMKILGGRLAAKEGTSVISNVVSFDNESAINMYFGGLALKKQKSKASTHFYALGSGAFTQHEPTGTSEVESVSFIEPSKPLVLRGTKDVPQHDANLSKSNVVVGAGRGFAHEEDLDLARQLCQKVKGDLACSRPLAESVKWLPRSVYLGVSGLMISPKVYIAVGLSGQMQHMIGINGAETIIAINKDCNAPIFKQADYGLVGDLYKVLPALIEKIG